MEIAVLRVYSEFYDIWVCFRGSGGIIWCIDELTDIVNEWDGVDNGFTGGFRSFIYLGSDQSERFNSFDMDK